MLRIDGEDGTVVERLDVGGAGCEFREWPVIEVPFDGAANLFGSAQEDPETACFLRVPLDGSATTPYLLSSPPKRAYRFDERRQVAPIGSDLILIAADTKAGSNSSSLDENALFRIGEDGSIERVAEEVYDSPHRLPGQWRSWSTSAKKPKLALGVFDPVTGTLSPRRAQGLEADCHRPLPQPGHARTDCWPIGAHMEVASPFSTWAISPWSVK